MPLALHSNAYYKFSEGLCPVVDEDKKFGFVDEIGKLVIPCKFIHALDFRDGLASVQEEGTFKNGYINHQGELVIPYGCNPNSGWLFEPHVQSVSP